MRIRLWINILLLITCFQWARGQTAAKIDSTVEEEKGTVTIIVKPGQHESLFKKSKVRYTILFKNTYAEEQEGKVLIEVKTDKGKLIYSNTYDVNIPVNSLRSIYCKYNIPQSGFYELTVTANLTSYDDTIKTVFGVKPLEYQTPLCKPTDFDQFWMNTKKELATVNPQYKITLDEAQSNASHHVYLVEMLSLNKVKVHGWLTIPRVTGKYPVMLGLPGYKVVLKPLYADDFVTFQFNVRTGSTELNDMPSSESDFVLYNIHDRDKYIYRGVYMDCVRALDFLTDNNDLSIDRTRIVAVGGSQGASLALVLAALDSRVKACVVDNPIYCDMHNVVEISGKKFPYNWPLNRFKEYMEKNVTYSYKPILNVMDYYDPQNFAPMVNCPVLLGLGLLDKIAPPASIFAMFNKLTPTCRKQSEYYCFYKLAHEVTLRHKKFQNQWLLEKLAHPMKEY